MRATCKEQLVCGCYVSGFPLSSWGPSLLCLSVVARNLLLYGMLLLPLCQVDSPVSGIMVELIE